DDHQSQHLPARLDIARAWRAGELPLLTPYSWHCAALAAEYQYAVFSLFEAACVVGVFHCDAPLHRAMAVLVILQLVVLAAGAFRLARGRGLSADLALLVAVITTLNGWNVVWGAMTWLPGLASFAWLPWFWWAQDRAVDGRSGSGWCLLAGVFLYLVIAAGWPFSVLMCALVTLW